MLIFLIKSSAILFVLLAFYKIALERESFFRSNRQYLIIGLVLVFILPFISLPELISEQGILEDSIQILAPSKTPNSEENRLILKGNSSAETPLFHTDSNNEQSDRFVHVLTWAKWIYLFGAFIFLLHLFTQLINIALKIWKNDDRIIDGHYIIINSNSFKEPCSFFNYIFINPEKYDYEAYEQILEHEKIHVRKKHSWDLLLSEIAVIILWFNPLVWLYRKQVEKNLEYQTDHILVQDENQSTQLYQMNLVKIASHHRPLTVTTNYNQSLIKQRLLKMNAKRSNPHSLWKFAFVLPILLFMVLAINRPLEAAEQKLINSTKSDVITPPKSILDTHTTEPIIVQSDTIAKEKDQTEIKSRIKTDEIKKISTPKIKISSCEALIKAIREQNLRQTEVILKEIESSCLESLNEADKHQLEKVKQLIAFSKKIDTKAIPPETPDPYTSVPANPNTEESEIYCDQLKQAANNRNYQKVRRIILQEDLSCMRDINGEPAAHLPLLKRLVERGAILEVRELGRLRIEGLSEMIQWDLDDEEDMTEDCLELKNAALAGKEKKVRLLLYNLEPGCLKTANGEIDDLIHIKDLLKYEARLKLEADGSIIIYGLGMEIDLTAEE